MLELLWQAGLDLLQAKYLLPLALGTLVGVVGGALPGVTITMTIIVVLPFTFGLDPLQGLAAMTGVYVGGSAGGLVTATLLGIPGTPSSIATTFDGHPMARKGEAGRALWTGVWGSFFGGLLGGVFLIAATAPLARFALEFGPWEFFSLFILALSMVAGLVGASLLKGIIAGTVGALVTVLGNDPMLGAPRLTLGLTALEGGVPFLPVLIGAFAFAQIMTDVEKMGGLQAAVAGAERAMSLSVSHLQVLWDIVSRPFLLIWSSFVGLVIGVLPAIGGSAANIMAYDQAKKFSRRPQAFGSGIPEGIIASESANNANVGGSLVTIMAFGIPGDAVTAVMLGALTIHGIQSGPLFISQNGPLAYGIFAAYLLAHPIMVLIIALSARFMLRVVTVPKAALFPVVLVLCTLGAYALSNTMSNVYILLAFGLLGYAMVKTGFPLAPFILGVILGDQIEVNLIRSVMTDPDPWLFVTRPISGALLAASVASMAFAIWQHRRARGTPGPAGTEF
ncbi:MAG TPA: tripartite tricarboxylate transporter permease [Burkholderiales bacterium]|nr:tripartite tricarboxylate transporter permease [Burkholderiales bacterium]